MSELALSVLRLGFLALLWCAVLAVIVVLTRDLRAPRESVPTSPLTARRRSAANSRRRLPSMLVITEGHLVGTKIPLTDAPVLIGRVPEATLVLDDEYSSNRHARLVLGETGWMLEDLGSTNGTWIRNTRLSSPQPVDIGSTFRIGRTSFELRK